MKVVEDGLSLYSMALSGYDEDAFRSLGRCWWRLVEEEPTIAVAEGGNVPWFCDNEDIEAFLNDELEDVLKFMRMSIDVDASCV